MLFSGRDSSQAKWSAHPHHREATAPSLGGRLVSSRRVSPCAWRRPAVPLLVSDHPRMCLVVRNCTDRCRRNSVDVKFAIPPQVRPPQTPNVHSSEAPVEADATHDAEPPLSRQKKRPGLERRPWRTDPHRAGSAEQVLNAREVVAILLTSSVDTPRPTQPSEIPTCVGREAVASTGPALVTFAAPGVRAPPAKRLAGCKGARTQLQKTSAKGAPFGGRRVLLPKYERAGGAHE